MVRATISIGRQSSPVLPALLRKFHDAAPPIASCGAVPDSAALHPGYRPCPGGSGTPRREFLHVDDLARACLYVMEHDEGEDFLNVGVGTDVSIRELAGMIRDVVGFDGRIDWDASKPVQRRSLRRMTAAVFRGSLLCA